MEQGGQKEVLGWCFSFFVFLNETLVRGLLGVISQTMFLFCMDTKFYSLFDL